MTSDYDLFPPKAAAAIQALLPGKAWKDVSMDGPAPVTAVADWIHVRDTIGMPAAYSSWLALVRAQ